MIALASAEITEGQETAPKASVQKACDKLKLEKLLDDEKRLTPGGLEAALVLEAQAREVQQDGTGDELGENVGL